MADDTGWLIEAVERAALKRAMDAVLRPEFLAEHLRVVGLTIGQVIALRSYYLKHSGQPLEALQSEKVQF